MMIWPLQNPHLSVWPSRKGEVTEHRGFPLVNISPQWIQITGLLPASVKKIRIKIIFSSPFPADKRGTLVRPRGLWTVIANSNPRTNPLLSSVLRQAKDVTSRQMLFHSPAPPNTGPLLPSPSWLHSPTVIQIEECQLGWKPPAQLTWLCSPDS